MGDWTELGFDGGDADLLSLGMLSEASPLVEVLCFTGGLGPASGAWESSNLAKWVPILVQKPLVIYGFVWLNGTTASGNLDVGVYDNNLKRLASLGSTAQSGTSVMQSASLGSALSLDPGTYNLAMAMDNATGTLSQQALNVSANVACGRVSAVGQMASAFPLPSTLTYANPTTIARIPVLAAALKAVF